LEVRDVVRRDWTNAQRTRRAKYHQALLRRYAVTVERPQPVMATETNNARRHAETAGFRCILLAPLAASAHEVRQASLQYVKPTRHLRYALKVPGRGDNLRLGLVELPTDCVRARGEPRASFKQRSLLPNAGREPCRWLDGATIHIAGATMMLVRLERT
jgi:hypothetical protein